MNQGTINKLLNMVLVLVFAISSFSIFSFYRVSSQSRGLLSEPFSRNMLFPDKSVAKEIRYYNGNTFISMNTADFSTRSLTTLDYIPNITQVFWLANGVVFSTTESTFFTDLNIVKSSAFITEDATESDSTPMYWYLSFSSNTIQSISNEVTQPDMFGVVATDGSFVFKEGNGSYSFITKEEKIFHGVFNLGAETKPIFATSDSLTYLVQSDSKVLLKTIPFDNREIKTLSENVFNDDTSSITSQVAVIDSNHLVYKPTKPDQKVGGDVYLYNFTNNSRKKLFSSFDGSFTQTNGNVIALSQGRELNTLYDISGDGVVNKLIIERSRAVPTTVLKTEDAYIYNTLSGNSYLVSKNSGTINSIKGSYKGNLERELTGLPEGTYLTRDIESPYDTSYIYTFNGKATDALNIVRSAISNKGYDPNQFIITLAPGRYAEF